MRQDVLIRDFDPPAGATVSTLAHEYKSGFEVPHHAHGSDQLIYAISGVMEVSTENRVWIIPPQFAVWIPARVSHSIHMPRAVSMRTLYIRSGKVARSPECSVLHVSPLLRELIVEAVRLRRLRTRNRHESALRDLLAFELQRAGLLSTFVALPCERRALALARSVVAEPGCSVTFDNLCAQNGATVRTMQRLFQKELGSDFGSWRRQVRITKAVELLASGLSVKETSYQVGYSQSSAFIQTFRRLIGVTPKAWIKSLARD
jgi:AraC-like DNA-binding protein